MRRTPPKVRLYLDAPFGVGQSLEIGAEQGHYLKHVMRLSVGDEVLVFNGHDGEWRASIERFDKKRATLRPSERVREQEDAAGPWLVFAPLKRGPMDLIVTKACELGVGRLQPVATERTVASRTNPERMRALAIEAAEQCGRCTLPDIAEAERLDSLLDGWNADRRLLFCDERGAGVPIADLLFEAGPASGAAQWAVLIGPEGGFGDAERERLLAAPFVSAVDLGPRVLRAETAAIAALSCLQAMSGDWRTDGPAAAAAAADLA